MNEEEKKEVKEEIKSEFLEKEKSDKVKAKWLNYLSMTTILFSLCATLSSFNGGGYSGQAMSSQIKASDQWAFFQSKSIKEYLYEIQMDNLQTQLLTMQPGIVYDSTKKHLDTYEKSVAKYIKEKEQISTAAKGLEATRDDAQKHGKPFGLAVVFLQVSILLSAIAALIKNKIIWYISMAPGLVGVIYFINGFLLFF